MGSYPVYLELEICTHPPKNNLSYFFYCETPPKLSCGSLHLTNLKPWIMEGTTMLVAKILMFRAIPASSNMIVAVVGYTLKSSTAWHPEYVA